MRLASDRQESSIGAVFGRFSPWKARWCWCFKLILRDIDSLDGHTAFAFDKINFLMDATVGFININQNKIIKLFSVASVALLPPTLIASVYGMNFKAMPELDWALGYPYALGLMAVSVIAPFWFFRRKGWL